MMVRLTDANSNLSKIGLAYWIIYLKDESFVTGEIFDSSSVLEPAIESASLILDTFDRTFISLDVCKVYSPLISCMESIKY